MIGKRKQESWRRSYEQSQFRAPAQPGADCAKQTQSGGASWRTGTDCAKRTQFGAAWLASWGDYAKRSQKAVGGSQWPVASCTNKANWPGGVGVRCTNKANRGRPKRCPHADSAEQSQFRQSAGGAQGEMRQTNPSLGELGYLGDRTAGTNEGQMRQTNPICATGAGRAWYKQSQLGWSQLCETNPIPAIMPIRRSAFPGGQSCDIASMPRFGKQSQFGTARARTLNPRRGGYAKQTQTWALLGYLGQGGASRTILPNKANSGMVVGRAQRLLYKQSQFPPRRQDGQRLGGQGVMVNRTVYRPRQNKANSGEVRGGKCEV
jgi:hypothetical protein